MKRFSTIICVVLDGVGVGEAPDADRYGDLNSNSLGNTAARVGPLRLPVMEALGLGNLTAIEGVRPRQDTAGCYGKMKPVSPGKDSTTGHWELMGCILDRPFPTYPDGFPPEVIGEFERLVGTSVLGNAAASGTEIMERLGREHLRTGRPIVYTSQDSVFQIAAHEAVIPVEELYRICSAVRRMLMAPHLVARVIARPFTGSPGAFHRTPRRRDFSLPPTGRTVLDALVDHGETVLAVGKINDLFDGRGITDFVETKNNREGMDATLAAVRRGAADVVFTNLVDFDTMWGHRNDARAYALGLEEFDSYLRTLLEAIDDNSLLIITSDHGNDPTTPGTDHSREFVPLLVFHRGARGERNLGARDTLADVGQSIVKNFGIEEVFPGTSFLV